MIIHGENDSVSKNVQDTLFALIKIQLRSYFNIVQDPQNHSYLFGWTNLLLLVALTSFRHKYSLDDITGWKWWMEVTPQVTDKG